MVTLYGIKTCDTCKKARKWLDERGVEYRFHDLRADGLSPDLLQRFIDDLSFEKLLNKSSTSWRQLRPEQQAGLNPEKAKALMLEVPTLIKRPVLDTGNGCVLGFKPELYDSLNLPLNG